MNPTLEFAICSALEQRNIHHTFRPDPLDPLEGRAIDVGPLLAVRVYEIRPKPYWLFEGEAMAAVDACRTLLKATHGGWRFEWLTPEDFAEDVAENSGVDPVLLTVRHRRYANGCRDTDLVVADRYAMSILESPPALPRHFKKVRSAMREAIAAITSNLVEREETKA